MGRKGGTGRKGKGQRAKGMTVTRGFEPSGSSEAASAIVATFVLIALMTSIRAQAPAAAVDAAELTALERVWNEAHVRGDADALDRLFADDIVVTVPGMPLMGKSASLGVIRNARMKFDRYETTDVQVHAYDRSAVVTGRLRRSRTNDGRTVEDDWRFTKTYVRRGDRWQVVAFHASPTP